MQICEKVLYRICAIQYKKVKTVFELTETGFSRRKSENSKFDEELLFRR